MTIALVLDTNVIRQEGLASRNMQLLSRLTASTEVLLFVPDMVAREFVSQRIIEIRDQTARCITALTEIGRQVDSRAPMQADFARLRTELTELEQRTSKEVEIDFARWVKSSSARMINFDTKAMSAILDDYFVGGGVFRKPKYRDDIPDAIVGAAVKSLLADHKEIHIAIKDGAFKKHLHTEKRYILIDDLTQFFALEEIVKLIGKLDAEDANVESLKNLFRSEPTQAALTSYLKGASEMLDSVYVEEEQLSGIEMLELDVWGPSLNYAQARAIQAIRYGDVAYIDRGHFSLEVVIETKARIDFAADFMDFQSLDSSREVEEWSMDGDGACDLREVRNVILQGHLNLSFEPNLKRDAVEAHMNYLNSTETKIDIQLEVDRAEIL